MAAPYAQSLSNTPQRVLAASAGRFKLETLNAYNPDASSGCYLKIYQQTTSPDASAVPKWSAWIPAATDRAFALFIDGADGDLWLAAATQSLAGLTAPSTALVVSQTTERT